MLDDPLGIALATRARARRAARLIGARDAQEQRGACPESVPDYLRPDYHCGYAGARARLLSRPVRPVEVNRARDND